MTGTTAKQTIAKAVNAKVQECKCLVCDSQANGNRGLCSAHYQQFYREMNSLPRRERAKFESDQIREGLLLASGYIKKLKKPSPFKRESA